MAATSRRGKGGRQLSTHLLAFLGVGALLHACAGPSQAPAGDSQDPFPSAWTLLDHTSAVEAEAGMVVSGHPLASEVGAEILERGGNAIDAAVAVGFALAVVMPEAGNLGGGGFLLYREADGEMLALDFRERAPGRSVIDMYLDDEGQSTDRSLIGHLAAGVPGTVAGLASMHGLLGSLPWEDLLAPAIELARGHVVDEVRSSRLNTARERLSRFEASARQFLVAGEAPRVGTELVQSDLADTLIRIADERASGFYRGRTADLIVAEMDRGGGLISHRDLESYEPLWREPIGIQYRDHVIWSMPPSSSGGITMAMIFNVIEGFDLLPTFGSAQLLHLETEAMRWAFVDRNRYLGDPDFVDIPLDTLLSDEYARDLRARIEPSQATPSPVGPSFEEASSTTHYSIVDAEGRAAAITTTLNARFGSAVMVTGAGFLLNNEMDDFATRPGVANRWGLVQGEVNAIAPDKRMLSSMSPTIVEDSRGELRMLLGSRGGSSIITQVFQVISNVLDHDMTLVGAVAAPRIHHQALPDVILYEPSGLLDSVRLDLEEMGYQLEERPQIYGGIQAILRTPDGWVGVSDPRQGGAARGTGVRTVEKVAAAGAM